MANVFPAAGNVGIGTTAPHAPLHVFSGSGLLAWFQQDPNVAGPGYIALSSSNHNDTWRIVGQDQRGLSSTNGLAFTEATGPNPSPTARVYFQQGGNVGIGILNNGAPFAVTNASGSTFVQLQGGAIVPGGFPALSLGYGDSYDSVTIGDAGYIQAEYEGVGFRTLYLNPVGGAVVVGNFQTQYGLVDFDQSFNRYSLAGQATPRFGVSQYVASGATAASGGVVTAGFPLMTVATYPAIQVAGRFVTAMSGGVAGGVGTGSVRAIQANNVRSMGASAPGNQDNFGVEVGLHSISAGNQLDQNVGVYIESNHVDSDGTVWAPSGVRNDAAIYIDGEDGWYKAILFLDTSGGTQFWVAQYGDVYASAGKFQIDSLGAVTANGTLTTRNAGTRAELFNVDTGGNVTASGYTPPPSSRVFKTGIKPLGGDEAVALLDSLNPVSFSLRTAPNVARLGFVAEEAPPPVAPSGVGISLSELLAVLTRVYQEHKALIQQQEAEISALLRAIETWQHPTA